MDLTTTALPLPTKSPDSENDTPPHDIQPIKSLSFTNGVLKKHHPHRHNHHHHQNRPSPLVVTYKECLKNHAASMGGHALDGCGEFMSSTTTNSADPTSLKCAACGCHRNFHRQEPDEYFSPTITTATTTHFLDFQRHPPPPPPTTTTRRFSSSPSHSHSHSPSPSLSHSPPPIQQSYPPNMLLALSTMHDNSQPMNHHHHHHHHVARPVTPTTLKGENSSGRKRSRTKFTQEQKEKMHSFSEKIGWKLQKVNESMVGQFCDEIGVARGVLKVWMHNNKHTFSKKDMNNINGGGGVENGKVLSIEINNNGGHNIDDESQNGNIGSVHLHVSNNESSSTS